MTAMMWDQVAPAWGANAEYQEQRAAGLTARMLAATKPQAGDRVLELACGAGGTGLAAAQLVGPTGSVVLSDASPEMVAMAAAHAEEHDAPHQVQARVIDMMRIEEPDSSFEVVLCREGLMFVPDPTLAAAEIHRVLAPGGRCAVSVWGPSARNPWLALVFGAVRQAQPDPPGPPDTPRPARPGPFALADAEQLTAALTAGGFSDVAVEEVDVPMQVPDAQAWWTRTTSLAGPLQAALARMSPQEQDATRERAIAATAPFHSAGGIHLPGLALLATAKR